MHAHTRTHTYIYPVFLVSTCSCICMNMYFFFYVFFTHLSVLQSIQEHSKYPALFKTIFLFCFVFFTVNLVTVHLINKNVKILFQHCGEKKGVVLLFIIKVNSYMRQFATTSAGSSFLRQRKVLFFFRPCHTTIFTVILPTRPW